MKKQYMIPFCSVERVAIEHLMLNTSNNTPADPNQPVLGKGQQGNGGTQFQFRDVWED